MPEIPNLDESIAALPALWRIALVESFAQRSQDADERAVATFWAALGARVAEIHNEAGRAGRQVLAAANRIVAQAEIAEIGAVFLDDDGKPIAPFGDNPPPA